MEEKLEKIRKMGIVLIILISINLIISLANSFSVEENKTTVVDNTTTTTTTYDVSMMNELNLSGVLKLFEDKKSTYVVYFGRESCSACVSFLPTLQKMQSKYNYVTQYLDITTVDVNTDDYLKLQELLSKEVTVTVNKEEQTDKYGSFYGYTPMTFIIEKGKFKDGIIGAYSESKFEEFLNNNGIK